MTAGEKAPGIIALVGLVAVLLFLGWGRIQEAEHRADVAEARVERLRERVNQLKRFIESLDLEAPPATSGQISPTTSTGGQPSPAGEQDGGPGPGQEDEKDGTKPPPETGGGGGPPGGTPPPSPSPPPPEDDPPLDLCERLPEVCEL